MHNPVLFERENNRALELPSGSANHFAATFVFVAVMTLAAASHATAQVQKLPQRLGVGMTPAERYALGVRKSGAYSINDVENCSPEAIVKTVPPQGVLKPLDFIYGIDPSGPRVAQNYINGLLNALNRTIEVLVKLDDTIVAAHHICAGLYNYGYVNAIAYSSGYILADPRIIELMFHAEHRSMLSIDQVYLHEFAHQIQYWVGNPYLNDATARRRELAADCIGAGLLGLTYRNWSPELLDMEALGMVHAAELGGDRNVNDSQHHGTPEERMRAVKTGLNFVRSSVNTTSPIPWSMRIAGACNRAVK